MRTVEIWLPSTAQVEKFASTLIPLEGDFELIADNSILDARSFMGIFSFDLTKPIKLKIYVDSEENLRAISPFLTKEGSNHEK